MTLFLCIASDNSVKGCMLPSLSCPESILSVTSSPVVETTSICESYNAELTMLDLYAGCGAMSTGLCTGARLSGVNLVTVISSAQLREIKKHKVEKTF